MDQKINSSRHLHSLCIVAPFYNEQDNIEIFYQTLCSHLEPLGIEIDFVFVDDGSRDNTLLLLNSLAAHHPRITVLSFARNFGHQIALTAGLDYSTGEAVVVMDTDLQHPPAVIPSMIEHYEDGVDVVYGVREQAQNLGVLKKITSAFYYALFKRMTRVAVIPGSADFRLMSRPVVDVLCQMRETHRYLRGMVPWIGFSSTTITYHQPDRYAGRSQYSWRKMLQLARHGFFSFSTVPLDMITWMGFTLTILAVVYLIYIMIITVLGKTIPGWTSGIAVALIIGGAQLISLGFVAQYVGMIFEEVKERPLYVLKQRPPPKNETEALHNR